MNAESIATYISNLEKENAELKARLQKCEEEKAILEYESMLHYAQVSDDESVASYTEESDDDFEPDEYTQLSDSETDSDSDSYSETDSESEYETDDDDDFFVCYNSDLVKAFDELADREENEYKKYTFRHAANMIHGWPSKITSGEQISHVNGIGKGIIQRIDKFLETGNTCRFVTNDNIADELELLAQVQENPHKSETYEKAADAIRKLTFEVTNGTEISQGPRKVPGIGKGIANKIDEYIATGEIRALRQDENLGRLNIGPRRVVK